MRFGGRPRIADRMRSLQESCTRYVGISKSLEYLEYKGNLSIESFPSRGGRLARRHGRVPGQRIQPAFSPRQRAGGPPWAFIEM